MKRVWVILIILSSAGQVYGTTSIGSTLDSCTVVAGSGIFTWTSPENGAVKDGATASVSGLSSDTYSDYLKCINNTSTLSVPADGIITGIYVSIKRSCSGAGLCVDDKVRIVKNGTIGSTERATTTSWPTTLTNETHGAVGDLWGDTWTPADVNSPNFGIAISVKGLTGGGGTGLVDGTFLFVDYETPTPTPGAATPTSTPTSKIRCITLTPTPSVTSTSTRTLTSTVTATPPPGSTVTNTPANTNTPTNTSTPTRTATSTSTAVNTFTATPVNTATRTNTPLPTATDTATIPPPNTSTATNTPVPVSTSTATIPPPNTSTATKTPVAISTSTATATRTSLIPATRTATGTRTTTPTKGSPTVGPTPMKTYAAYKLSLPDATTNPPNKAWADELVRRLRLNEFCGYTACKNINSSVMNNVTSGVQTSGHLEFVNNKPTVTACGTGASIAGSDSGGTITTGSTSTTSCTITFNKPWNNPPTCVVNMTAAADPRMFGATTTAVTIVYNASTSAIIRYVCIGS
jgi:hypothetical protein